MMEFLNAFAARETFYIPFFLFVLVGQVLTIWLAASLDIRLDEWLAKGPDLSADVRGRLSKGTEPPAQLLPAVAYLRDTTSGVVEQLVVAGIAEGWLKVVAPDQVQWSPNTRPSPWAQPLHAAVQRFCVDQPVAVVRVKAAAKEYAQSMEPAIKTVLGKSGFLPNPTVQGIVYAVALVLDLINLWPGILRSAHAYSVSGMPHNADLVVWCLKALPIGLMVLIQLVMISGFGSCADDDYSRWLEDVVKTRIKDRQDAPSTEEALRIAASLGPLALVTWEPYKTLYATLPELVSSGSTTDAVVTGGELAAGVVGLAFDLMDITSDT